MMEDLEDIQNQIIINKRKAAQEKADQLYRENSKRRLLATLDKKFNTTMIGALARFEEEFGELWGHKSEDITAEQAKYRERWQAVRDAVLDNGNKQRRAAQEEIAQYTMSWNKYKTEFIIKKG